jgi:hypothetical protein
MDWKGEAAYLEARGVDYIAQLPGSEDPGKWYDRFPGLAAARDVEAEEEAPIEMMIARDTWKWMPVRQASRLTERQDKEDVKDMRFLARTQFGKRLLLLRVRKPTRSFPSRKTRRNGTPRGGSAEDPRPQQRCWDEKKKKTRNG